MLRLHMHVWQPGTEQKTSIKYFRVLQYLVDEEDRKLFVLQAGTKFEF